MADLSKSIPAILEQLVLTAGITDVTVYTASVDAPSLTLGLVDSVDVTVTGVAIGDLVIGCVTTDNSAASGDVVVLGATVVAANTVRVTFFNTTGGTIDATAENYDFITLGRN